MGTTRDIHQPILISGGGLGGLAAALGLARIGRRSVILEQSPQFGEIGAGIQMAPNAFNAFDWLGIGAVARKGAVFIDELVLMDAVGGERIAGIPLGDDFRKRFGNPYAVVHRADLHEVLLESCRASGLVELKVSSRVESYRQDDRGVSVTLASGATLAGSGLIGADGLRSNVRKQVVGDGEPVVSGHTTYRSVIPAELMAPDLRWNAATLWAGPKCHLVHYPLKGGKVFNLVVTSNNDATEAAVGKPVSKEEVHRSFPFIGTRARQIIEHGQEWKRWVLCDREPVSNWVEGRVVLLGDAAHPMLQYFAQGACMALEDAVCLARSVEHRGDDMERAFVDYNRLRAPRTGRVQISSRLIGEYLYHPAGAKAEIRNAAVRARAPADFYNSLEWLYGHSPDGSMRRNVVSRRTQW